MRIVAISDLHADKETIGVPRFDEVARAFGDAASFATHPKTRADVLVCLGDISDPDNGGATMKAIELVAQMSVELLRDGVSVILVAGNHDVVEDGSGTTCLTPIRPLEFVDIDGDGYRPGRVFVAEGPRTIDVRGVRFLCLPYPSIATGYDPAASARALLDNARTRGDLPVVVLSHLMVPGIVPGEETTEMPRGRDVLFPLEETRAAAVRLSGHYHRRQVFDPRDGGPPIHVVGSPAIFTFGEDHEPAFLVIDV